MKSSMEYEAVEKYENMPDAVSSEVVKFDSFEEIEDIVTSNCKRHISMLLLTSGK